MIELESKTQKPAFSLDLQHNRALYAKRFSICPIDSFARFWKPRADAAKTLRVNGFFDPA